MILRFVLYPTGGGLDKGNGEDVIKGFVDFDHQNADFRPEMSEQGEVIFVPGAEFRSTWVRKGIMVRQLARRISELWIYI